MYSPMIIWACVGFLAGCLAANTPTPLEIPPSQWYEGNDGPWSTFDIRVGTPEQYLRVLPSTAAPYSIVALADFGCIQDVWSVPVPLNCSKIRGNLFAPNTSSTWQNVGQYSTNADGVGLDANLGVDQRAQWGLDHLGLGLMGPSLVNQTIAGIATPSPFLLGMLGLNDQPVNFTTLGNYSAPSLFQTLRDQKKIPSLSWSYTVGAQYRLKNVFGQLIFGGYDTSRFEENTVSFTMAGDITRDLVVALQSISYSGQTSSTLLSTSINIFIDSTDPNLWLPGDAVDAFEKAFGLTLDETSGLYLINDTRHLQLWDQNPEVTFRLSDVEAGGDAVAVTLPYRAFGLVAEPPLVAERSRYFPLKRATNATQYTLGRTFLQEAYLSVDYERKVFNVSACTWIEGAKSNIVAIPPVDSVSDPGGNSTEPAGGASSSDPHSGLSKGAIAGIVVACVVVGLLAAAAIVFFVLRKRRKWINKGFNVAKIEPAEPDMSVLHGPVFNSESNYGPHSTPDSAAPILHAHSRSTNEYTRNGSTIAGSTPARSVTTGDNEPVGGSTVELDGRDTLVRPNTELDGREIHPIAENPGVYELPGTEVADGGLTGDGRRVNPSPSAVASSPSNDGRQSHSPPSPFTSTWDGDRPVSEMVSPTTPRHHSRF